MEKNNLNNLSVSHLILIMQNNGYPSSYRAEAERVLRKRVRNVGWKFDELCHMDDKVHQERGLNISHYLIGPYASLQKLMEVYFNYNRESVYETNGLLFSEKHLCNEYDLFEPFFRRVCDKELQNIERRLRTCDDEVSKKDLQIAKRLLEARQERSNLLRKESLKDAPMDIFSANEAMCQLHGTAPYCHEYLRNATDKEIDQMLKSKIGYINVWLMEKVDDTIFYPDFMQQLYGLHFVRKDAAKLKPQMRKIMGEVEKGVDVDYQSPEVQKVFSKFRKSIH